jgi:hypothetical protein
MVDIESRVAVIETQVGELIERDRIRADDTKQRWVAHDYAATEYRQEIRALITENKEEFRRIMQKIDEFLGRLSNMPCQSHIQKFAGYETQFRLIWTFMLAIIAGLIGVWLR